MRVWGEALASRPAVWRHRWMAVHLSPASLSISEVALLNWVSRIRALAHWLFHWLIDSAVDFWLWGVECRQESIYCWSGRWSRLRLGHCQGSLCSWSWNPRRNLGARMCPNSSTATIFTILIKCYSSSSHLCRERNSAIVSMFLYYGIAFASDIPVWSELFLGGLKVCRDFGSILLSTLYSFCSRIL